VLELHLVLVEDDQVDFLALTYRSLQDLGEGELLWKMIDRDLVVLNGLVVEWGFERQVDLDRTYHEKGLEELSTTYSKNSEGGSALLVQGMQMIGVLELELVFEDVEVVEAVVGQALAEEVLVEVHWVAEEVETVRNQSLSNSEGEVVVVVVEQEEDYE
jgi:hypothetical protein